MTDLLTFIKDLNGATANVQVNNLTPSDVVALHGYTGFSLASAPTTSSAVLSLSDGTQVTFTGISAASVQQAVRTV